MSHRRMLDLANFYRLALLATLMATATTASSIADDESPGHKGTVPAENARAKLLPFPENRVRDYYAKQAVRTLQSPRPWPELLPAFPGMDGGSFGHWGQNPESDNFDYTLNEMQLDGLLAQVTQHFGETTYKAVNIRFGPGGNYSALFDPEHLVYADVWKDGFVKWRPSRFGITSGVAAEGVQISDAHDEGWTIPEGVRTRYRGFFRNGRHVIFHYQIGDAQVHDYLMVSDGKVTRAMSVEGEIPPSVRAGQGIPTTIDHGETRRLARGGAARWSEQDVITVGQRAASTTPIAVDTLTIPYGNKNPFGTPMRIGGFDFLSDGRIAISTLAGDVWLVGGINDSLDQLHWKRIAAGLNQPLGLTVQNDTILVIGRDQLTRLHDLNGDDEVDYYECVTHEFPTAGGDGFATELQQDDQGRLYWFTYSRNFGVTRFAADSGAPPESIATGLRGTNGLGVSPDGKIVLASAQEGTWTPASAIFEVGEGSYHGFSGPRKGLGQYGYKLPLCFLPRGVDNSCGGMTFLPNDSRLGPLAGQIIGTSYGDCKFYLVLRETIGGRTQGGVVPLPGEFLSGAHRARFNSRDGCVYVAGTDGWQSYAQANGSLQRVRYTGRPLPLPVRLETRSNGLVVHFSSAIDPNSVRIDRVFCEQWNYLYSAAYGSPEFSVRQPGRRGHDLVQVRSMTLLDGGRSVFVEVPQLHPVMQFHLYLQMATADGNVFPADIYGSIFNLGEPFVDFPSYQRIAKRRSPGFPTPARYPRDARLIAQDKLGTDFSTLDGIFSIQVNAVEGLRYEPTILRVPPNRRVALVFKNADSNMQHNWVLVRPERMSTIGQAAMLLAADPKALANHYVPNDNGVLAFSPILDPSDQYTVYFDSPAVKGAYPFICTFPGHWQVMRGVLYVLDDHDPLPEDRPIGPQRQFVRMWKLEDLAAEADSLAERSYEQGRAVFQNAGCHQCHKIAGQGADLGPDLTDIRQRFHGSKLLQQILEPSSEINKQYQSYAVYLIDGTTIHGMIATETDSQLSILTDPLHPKDVAKIERTDIDELEASAISTMPKGLLMTMNREEILDLLAYITAGGHPDAQVFTRP